MYGAAAIDRLVVDPTICSYCYCYTFHDPYIYIYIHTHTHACTWACVCLPCECFGNIMQCDMLLVVKESHFCNKWIALFTNFKTFKTAYHLPQSWVTWIQSMPFQPTSIRSILISASHLRLGLQHGIYFCLFPDQFHHWPLDSGQQILVHFTIQTHILAVRHKRHWATVMLYFLSPFL